MKTRDISLSAVFAALLVGVQLALSFAYGLELVSALLAVFSCMFGAKRGVTAAVVFSLLRCVLFGFLPNVIVLYLAYYPLYALICALAGKLKGHARHAVLVASAALLTICFTLLDDLITPLMLGMTKEAWKVYFYGSFLAMVPQTLCVAVATFALFFPLEKLFGRLRVRYFDDPRENPDPA